jgi:hypothetical protein
MIRWGVIAAALVACSDAHTTHLQGVVVHGWEAGAPPTSGATVRTFNAAGDELDQTETSTNGWFRAEADPGRVTVVHIDGAGLVPAVFQGNPGLNPRFRIPNGEVFAIPSTRWSAELDRWEGCPHRDEPGTLFAEVAIDGFIGGEDGEIVRAQSAFAEVFLDDGRSMEPCYLDEDGVYSSSARRVGPEAVFLLGGIPPGRHVVEVTYEPIPRLTRIYVYDLIMTEGAVAPRIPLLVPFE